MAFALKRGRGLGNEARRRFDRQLLATADALRVARAHAAEVRKRLWRHHDAQDEPPGELEARLLSLWLSGEPLADDPKDMPWTRSA